MRTREDIRNRISLLVGSVGSRIVPRRDLAARSRDSKAGVDWICTLMFIDSVFAPIGSLRSATCDSSGLKMLGGER